jgi:hypothetical protein
MNLYWKCNLCSAPEIKLTSRSNFVPRIFIFLNLFCISDNTLQWESLLALVSVLPEEEMVNAALHTKIIYRKCVDHFTYFDLEYAKKKMASLLQNQFWEGKLYFPVPKT